ncbi:MAG: metalloprotease TldD, partial [Dehalococcoidia bacterium]|nr:metalloprotease TldD [Dehalococcoidia bacterium]
MPDPAAVALQFFRERFAIDPAVTSSLLSVALSRGGDFAELYFEHRTNSAITWEDQQVKSASRTVSQGVGIRVVRGDAIGYAYTESFELAAMRRAAETAARICAGERTPPPIDATPFLVGTSCYEFDHPLVAEPASAKVALLERADRAARSYDPSIVRLDASIGDELKYILIARSDGKIVGDVQPLIRFNVSALSQRGESRQLARQGGGGLMVIEYFEQVTCLLYTTPSPR